MYVTSSVRMQVVQYQQEHLQTYYVPCTYKVPFVPRADSQEQDDDGMLPITMSRQAQHTSNQGGVWLVYAVYSVESAFSLLVTAHLFQDPCNAMVVSFEIHSFDMLPYISLLSTKETSAGLLYLHRKENPDSL